MKTTTVTARYERKLNTGNYSSVTLGAWATVELDDSDNPVDAMASAMYTCREQVKEAAMPFIKKGVNVTDAEDGAPVAAGAFEEN